MALSIAETALRSLSDNRSRISNDLLALHQETIEGIPTPEAQGDLDLMVFAENESQVMVRITTENMAPTLASLEAMGFTAQSLAPELNFIEGFLPIAALAQLEESTPEGLLGVVSVARPERVVGRVTSQADAIQESDRVRVALPQSFDGNGVRIGIMSDSYDVSGNGSAAQDIASGDLPSGGVQVLQEGLDVFGIDEGRAMAQLIHDLAPGSDLVFSSVLFGEANFAQQIRDLADPHIGNADILVDDIFYLDEPMFQDGMIAQAIDDVVQRQGVAYFSSAGNQENQAYESTNFAGASDSERVFFGTFHDFDPGDGIDTRQRITLAPNQSFVPTLQWDDPFYTMSGVDTDLGIFLLEADTNRLLAGSDSNNLLSQIPNERFAFSNTTDAPLDVEVVILLNEGPAPGRIKYVNNGSNRSGPVQFNEFGPNSGTIIPHAAATGAQAVAAVNFFNQTEPAGFTSSGPSTILFTPEGDRLPSTEVRQTPDFAAIQGTDTTFFGFPFNDGNEFPNFFGTSAAAPHAAAIAALLLQQQPHLSPQQLYEQLLAGTIDVGQPGFDNQTGAGLLNAYDALFGSATPASLPFQENFDDGDLPLAFETNSTGGGRIQVTQDGSGQVVLDSIINGVSSLNELILRLDLADLDNVQLSFDQREFDDEDNPLPHRFTGSENGDGVALSVDGSHWFRLVDLTGENSTNRFQRYSLNLSQFAAERHLRLGSDVRIKFQQFDNASRPLDGFAFDNLAVTFGGQPGEMIGGSNDDRLISSADNDQLDGRGGQDILRGLAGDDRLSGGNGDDRLLGGAGNDILLGGNGQDQLFGGEGDDWLDGQGGDDHLWGGAGSDTFVLSAVGKSAIADFDPGQDLLALENGLSFGQLAIVQQGNNTHISTSNHQQLATLEGITTPITATSFVATSRLI